MIISQNIYHNRDMVFEYYNTQTLCEWSEILFEYQNNLLRIDNYIRSRKYIHTGLTHQIKQLKQVFIKNNITYSVHKIDNKLSFLVYLENRIFPVDLKEDRFFLFPHNKKDIEIINKGLSHIFKIVNFDDRIIQCLC
jgi:hypothetical protein